MCVHYNSLSNIALLGRSQTLPTLELTVGATVATMLLMMCMWGQVVVTLPVHTGSEIKSAAKCSPNTNDRSFKCPNDDQGHHFEASCATC